MKINWIGILREIATLQPAAVGRVVRIGISAFGAVLLGRGLSSEQASSTVAAVEIGVGLVSWIVAFVLSHTSDDAVKADASVAPMSERDLEKMIEEALEDRAGGGTSETDAPKSGGKP